MSENNEMSSHIQRKNRKNQSMLQNRSSKGIHQPPIRGITTQGTIAGA
jgi:hypothetical protein